MARRKVPVKVHLLSSATREGLEALLDDVAAAIWTDVSPKGGGRPKKAGRPRAAVEPAEPFVAEAAPARAASPKRAAKKSAVKPRKAAPKKAVARAKAPAKKAVTRKKKAVATRSRR